ncbi:MAG: cytochrome c maturation protein CcmE [Geminicoccaceae bacterium]
MRFRKRQRLVLIGLALLLLGGATALTLTALGDKIAFFVSPSEIVAGDVAADRTFRVGGLVVDGSIERQVDGSVAFLLTDTAHEIRVHYQGILPDLFRDGQGIVAQGTLETTGTLPLFRASEILAKHDENYMPREVADALKEAGYWQHDEAPAGGVAQ